MARWLTLRLAEAHGIAASIQTPFPFTWARRTVDEVLERPDADAALDPFGAAALPWRIHALLGRLEALDFDPDARAPLERYLEGDDGRRRGQLALRLARQFVNYQVQRPDGLARWQKGAFFGDAPLDRVGEAWQAGLWRVLTAEAEPALPLSDAWAAAVKRIVDPTFEFDLPPRVTVFGLSALPPAILGLLEAVAHRAEVTIASLSPTGRVRGAARNPSSAAFRRARGRGPPIRCSRRGGRSASSSRNSCSASPITRNSIPSSSVPKASRCSRPCSAISLPRGCRRLRIRVRTIVRCDFICVIPSDAKSKCCATRSCVPSKTAW